ncbi:hypothetical protein [Geopseudomonas aromaticivorans]
MPNRIILAIELIVLCGPAAAILSLGVLYLPVFLLGSVSGGGDWRLGSFIILCGTWGAISLANLAWHTLSKKSNWPGRPIQWFGIATGLAACILCLANLADSKIMLFIFSGPIIATTHLLYLSKIRKMGS